MGEPPAWAHPVVWMGRAILPLTRLRARSGPKELAIGLAYASMITLGAGAFAYGLESLVEDRPLLLWALHAFLLMGCFAWRGLLRAGHAVLTRLEAGDLAGARKALSGLCSRKTGDLTEAEIAGAAIESITENTSDSIVAPIFFYVLFGLPGLLFYRAANTLDAMVGYHGRYEYLGKTAARLDDVLNWLPARLTAVLFALCASPLGLSPMAGVRLCWRDARRTESPNAGFPMAMASGLLQVRLEKRDTYVLGAELRDPTLLDLRKGLTLVQLTGACALLGFGAALWLACGAAWLVR